MKKFDRLVKKIDENQAYHLNAAGKGLLNKYYHIRTAIEEALVPILTPYVADVEQFKKEISVQIISSINSLQLGNEEYNLMSRLDTLTNGGQTPIDPATYSFNNQDNILQYLEISG